MKQIKPTKEVVTLDQMRFDVRQEPLVTQSGILTPSIGIIRVDTNEVIGVVSERYDMVSHKQVIDTVMPEVEKLGNISINKIHSVNNGAKMFMELVVNNYEIEIKRNGHIDTVKPLITLVNSLDGSLRVGFVAGMYRLVCSNGLFIGTKIFEFVKKHISLEVSAIAEKGKFVIDYLVDKVVPSYKRMVETEFVDGRYQILREKLPSRILEKSKIATFEKVKGSDEIKDTRVFHGSEWDAYNNITRHLTHEFTSSFIKQLDHNNALVEAFGIGR